jgi:hypothetical protein
MGRFPWKINSINKRGGEDREVTVNSLELKIIGAS